MLQRLSFSFTTYQLTAGLFASAGVAETGVAGAAGAGVRTAGAAVPPGAGITYVWPTITLFGSAWSDGFALMIRSRLVFVLGPMYLAAMRLTVSSGSATCCVTFDAGAAELF